MKRLHLLFLIMIFVFSMISCGGANEEDKTVPVEETYEIHTQLQKDYLAADYKLISLYAKGKEELSKPLPITIKWNLDTDQEYKFYLSEKESFEEFKEYKTTKNEISLINLKVNTPYYWYVEYQGNKTEIKNFEIKTNGPRNLDIDGVTNVRDLGGYKGFNDKYTKQGLIIRSARFNENESTELLITAKGIAEMVDVLKVKTELDIRRVDNNENGGLTSSPLGDKVNYVSIPMTSGGNLMLLNNNVIKDVFAVFGDEANYPIVIHCSIGTDRTGLICFLINALLGVEEEALYRDYLFSNFGNISRGRTPGDVDDYITKVNTFQGSTLAEKTQNYLLSVGVKESDIETIKRVMLG